MSWQTFDELRPIGYASCSGNYTPKRFAKENYVKDFRLTSNPQPDTNRR
jgi:hypothetical protein